MSETDPLLPVPAAVSSRPIPTLSNLMTPMLVHMALTVVWVVMAFFRRVGYPAIQA